MIVYTFYTEDSQHLKIGDGFFNGWPNPPDKEKHKEVLAKSYLAIVAVDSETDTIIGFINAVSDGILSAYIPLLEVLSDYQSKGIGANLVKKMLDALSDFYMVDLCCDIILQPFYEKFGMKKSQGMIYRNYQSQCGRKTE